jgi:uncharacterized protein YcgI (DUF1989 family)
VSPGIKTAAQIRVEARCGTAIRLERGEVVRVINTHGQQVVDTWAFVRDDLGEYMSMEHTRAWLSRIMPKVGDAFVTNRRREILTLVADTSPGIHDTLIAACDRYRYELLGCKDYHDNCTDNLAAAMAVLGLRLPETPSPLNLFMNIPVHEDGSLSFLPPVSRPNDYVELRAELDCIVAFSACPQDIVPINGIACKPTDFEFVMVER